MAFVNKPSPQNPLNIQGSLPDPPKIYTEEMLTRFPEARKRQVEFDAWWAEVKKRYEETNALIAQVVNQLSTSTE